MTAAPPANTRPPAWAYVPAAAVLLVCGVLTGVVVFGKREPDAATLRARADAAVAAKDVETAVLTYQHLLAREPGVPAHALEFARALDALGKRSEAINLLGTIAPDAGGGEPAAHLQTARWLIEARVLGGQTDAAVLHRAVRHLDAAMASPGLTAEARDQKRLAEAMLGSTEPPQAHFR